jgi:hypothetical protein
MNMRWKGRSLLLALVLAPAFVLASGAREASAQDRDDRLLLYLPNRLFDLLDIVRLRVRAGPGFAIGVRASEAVDAEVGVYTSAFAGIPGPRARRRINLPVGLENYAGAEIAAVSGRSDRGLTGPNYGTLEFGAGFQAGLLGIDVGFDAGELADFATGFFLVELIEDDL